ncbi:MAG: type II toxin-antitoxin system VapC family toxin [Planctomycetes bacterium]|nr:type II toxin-antitoxin system VapC family toxin [Planctomycetota bacterium]
MTATLGHVFADIAFWIALVVKQDEYHTRAQKWALRIKGEITTTVPVLLETANALARPTWRAQVVALIDHVRQREDVRVIELSPDLLQRGWDLYRNRPDKAWSLTDCISFLVMQDAGLTDALAADEHFTQAGFRAVLLDEP